MKEDILVVILKGSLEIISSTIMNTILKVIDKLLLFNTEESKKQNDTAAVINNICINKALNIYAQRGIIYVLPTMAV